MASNGNAGAAWGRVGLAVLVGLAPACARRTDARTRRAWQKTAQAGPAEGSGPDASGDTDAAGEDERAPLEGWPRVAEIVERAEQVMAISPDAGVIAQLAQEWCGIEPEVQATDHGDVRVCFPDPPVSAGGHTFTLELGSLGVIGLVASDLSNAESRALAQEARGMTGGRCTRPWKSTPTLRGPESKEEFHTCSVAGGPILVVGRVPLPAGSDVWQVSIAVLGAS
jgi:hypothetical protein